MGHTARFAVGAAALALVACARQPPAEAPQSRGLEVDYAVQSTRPPESFELAVAGEGLARLVLKKAGRADPWGPVGFFAVRPTPQQRAELASLVGEHSLLDRHDEPGLTADGSGHLRLSHGARRAELSLTSKDEGGGALRLLLRGLIDSAKKRPLAALSVASRARMDGPNAVIDLALVHEGVDPLELSVLDPKTPDGTLSVRVVFERAGRLADERFLSTRDLERLVAKKKLPAGRSVLGPGEKLVVPLPLVTLPPAPAEVALRVEVAVLGRWRDRSARFEASSAPAPLEPETPPEE